LAACSGDDAPTAPPTTQDAQESQTEQEQPEAEETTNPELADVCEKAFELINTQEPVGSNAQRAVAWAARRPIR
jgi:hypothetical protein